MDEKKVYEKVLFAKLDKSFEKDAKGNLIVTGKFTSDNMDEVGDIITRSATERALPAYRQWGNIRYMHAPRPVGKALGIGEDDGLAWNEVKMKIVPKDVINEVEEGLLSALSVGIRFGFDDFKVLEDGGWIIENYSLVEISLVDHPANYDATLNGKNLDAKALKSLMRTKGVLISNQKENDMTDKEKALELEQVEETLEEVVESTEEATEEVVEEATEEVIEDKALDLEIVTDEVVEESTEEVVEEEVVEEVEVIEEVIEDESIDSDESVDKLNTDATEAIEVEEAGETEEAFDMKALATSLSDSVKSITDRLDALEAVDEGSEEQVDSEEVVEEEVVEEDTSLETGEAKDAKIADLERQLAEYETPVNRKGAVVGTDELKIEDVVEDDSAIKSSDTLHEKLQKTMLKGN